MRESVLGSIVPPGATTIMQSCVLVKLDAHKGVVQEHAYFRRVLQSVV